MAQVLTGPNLKAFFDANAAKYKTGPDVLGDGYLVTGHLENLLVAPVGTVPNPVAQPTIPKIYAIDDVIGALAAASAAKVVPLIASIQQAVDSQNRAQLAKLGTIMLRASLITAADVTAVTAVINAAQLDPTWPATVPGPSDLLVNFGVKVLPPNTETFTTGADGVKNLVSYITFVDAALGRPGVAVK